MSAVCACDHRAISHTYRATSHRNDGPCLSPGCTCTRLEVAA